MISTRWWARSGSNRSGRRSVHGLPRAASRQSSPHMYFIRMNGVSVVGSSPEMLVRVEGSRVENAHPIAGTRRRGKTDDGI